VKEKNTESIMLLVVFLILLMSSCSTAEKNVSGQPIKEFTRSEMAEAEAERAEEASFDFTVNDGDTLWDISGRDAVYGNPFLWPLIYYANRDSIFNPDLIYPLQKLKIIYDFQESEVDHAEKTAKLTPPYKPPVKGERHPLFQF